jgi:hypothetical protein
VVVRLRDLDERMVPRMAAALRRMLDGMSSTGAGTPARGGALRRLDDRFASRGPLKLLRDVPQLGLLFVASVFLAGAGTALALNSGPESPRAREERAVQRDAELPLELGPSVGQDIDAHFAAAQERLDEVVEGDAGAEHLALVSLDRALTPEQVAAFLEQNDLRLRSAYLRAPVPGNPEEITFETQGEVVAGLRQVFAQTSTRKAQEQQDLLSQAGSIPPGAPEEEAFRRRPRRR